MLTNLFIFLAFYSSDLNDNQRIDSDGMIERTYYLEQYRQEDQPSFSDAFRAARKELGPGKIFMWNNRYFTTNFYYETVIVIADEVVDVNKENKTYASEETLAEPPSSVYKCTMVHKNGNSCKKVYKHRKRLASHQKKVHWKG